MPTAFVDHPWGEAVDYTDEVFEPEFESYPDDDADFSSPLGVDPEAGGRAAERRAAETSALQRSAARRLTGQRAVPPAVQRMTAPTAQRVARSTGPRPAQEPAEHPATQNPSPGAPGSVSELQARIRQMQGTRLDTKSLPTHPAIAPLLPGGGLKQGAAYSVEQSVTLLMALLAGPSAAGSWCGVVGVPEFGVEAAGRYGIDLDRLVLVPHPGDQWLGVTAAIADVLTVVVTRPPRQASDGSVARLAARLRQRGSTLIVLGTWPQTDAMLSISDSRWSGIGDGHGHLAAREVTVTVSTRAGARPRSARLWLPDRAAQFTSAAPGATAPRVLHETLSEELAG